MSKKICIWTNKPFCIFCNKCHDDKCRYSVEECSTIEQFNFLNHKGKGVPLAINGWRVDPDLNYFWNFKTVSKPVGKEYNYIVVDEQTKLTAEQFKYLSERAPMSPASTKTSLFPTKGTRTIWIGKDGRHTPVDKLPIPYLRNIYELLWNSAYEITRFQMSTNDGDSINKVTEQNYPGRYELSHVRRTEKFLYEFCLTWPALFLRAKKEGICEADGTIMPKAEFDPSEYIPVEPKAAQVKIGRNTTVNNPKLVQDINGKQYVLFQIEP